MKCLLILYLFEFYGRISCDIFSPDSWLEAFVYDYFMLYFCHLNVIVIKDYFF